MAFDIFNPKHEFLAGLVFVIAAIATEQLVLFLHTIEDKGFWTYAGIVVLWLLTFSFIFSAILCFIHAYVDLKNPEPKTTQQ